MNGNEPAFPLGEAYTTTDLGGNTSTHRKGALKNGLTKREYFAAKAVSGMLANSAMYNSLTQNAIKLLAINAFLIADEMIKEPGNGR